MSEEKGKSAKETIAEEAKSVIGEVYKDVGRPVLAPVGKTAGSAVELLLAPADLIIDGLKAGWARLKMRLGKKLEGVPSDRLLPAPATIAGPAALHYAMLGDGDEVADLREMFENLLMSAMDRETAADAHPGFVAMISQMTPEDAWVAKSITQRDYAAFDVVEHHAQNGKRLLGVYSLLGVDLVKDGKARARCISNLERLGIIQITEETPSNNAEYEDVKKLIEAEVPKELNTWGSGKSIRVTPFGEQFLDACVRVRRS